MSDGFLGIHTGDCNKGYSSVLRQGVFDIQSGTPPKEQMANIAGCKHSWMDDFDCERPINNAALREITGQNTLAAERKHRQAEAFVYEGQVFACCNGNIKFTQPLVGADERRLGGIDFVKRYADEPSGPNEMRKDSKIKDQLKKAADEMLFLTLCYWLAPRPRPDADTTEPKPPNTLQLMEATKLLSGHTAASAEGTSAEEHVANFVAEKLKEYDYRSVEKPASADKIDESLAIFLKLCAHMNVSKAYARQLLKKHLVYKGGASLPAHGSRKRTTVNGYLTDSGKFYDLTQTG